jgi:hypothetical protein
MPPTAPPQPINMWGFRQKEGARTATTAAILYADNG